jgi:hypothetical protein
LDFDPFFPMKEGLGMLETSVSYENNYLFLFGMSNSAILVCGFTAPLPGPS